MESLQETKAHGRMCVDEFQRARTGALYEMKRVITRYFIVISAMSAFSAVPHLALLLRGSSAGEHGGRGMLVLAMLIWLAMALVIAINGIRYVRYARYGVPPVQPEEAGRQDGRRLMAPQAVIISVSSLFFIVLQAWWAWTPGFEPASIGLLLVPVIAPLLCLTFVRKTCETFAHPALVAEHEGRAS